MNEIMLLVMVVFFFLGVAAGLMARGRSLGRCEGDRYRMSRLLQDKAIRIQELEGELRNERKPKDVKVGTRGDLLDGLRIRCGRDCGLLSGKTIRLKKAR